MTYYVGQAVNIATKLNTMSSRYVQGKILYPDGTIQTLPAPLLGNSTSVLDSSLYAVPLTVTMVGQYTVVFEVFTSAIGGTQLFDLFDTVSDSYKQFNVVFNPLDELVQPHGLNNGTLGNVLLSILNGFGLAKELEGDEVTKRIEAPPGTTAIFVSRTTGARKKYEVGSNGILTVVLRPDTYDVYYSNCATTLGKKSEVITIASAKRCI